MILFATGQIAFGSFIILYSYQGILAIMLMTILIFAWVFFFPAFVYVIDSRRTERPRLIKTKVKGH